MAEQPVPQAVGHERHRGHVRRKAKLPLGRRAAPQAEHASVLIALLVRKALVATLAGQRYRPRIPRIAPRDASVIEGDDNTEGRVVIGQMARAVRGRHTDARQRATKGALEHRQDLRPGLAAEEPSQRVHDRLRRHL